ncbi:3-oxoacyl-[acyl-carrier-protein] synthase 2 [Rosistilla ulvae]|uniref:3-oxoacyl-[acyl-carrier-protein] synthase 2 n=1 Tax=Rosistilla ulvae TaxID=1930277 RepID=A0A517LUQ8_9BACT|nr:beta-ketoacyl-[acyl-carrier-protein] synthase family protein [Rosistilla ulvae]QDS86348.1 3-oxoacyl-[acyl-carrier-protein] synthase 2 [Rosistilla ulvae]
MRDSVSPRRVVITGVGLISPLGNQVEAVWEALRDRKSGVDLLQALPSDAMSISCGAEARDFTGSISEFGPLDKQLQRAIKKGLKLMCREIEMGVAAAQLALHDSGLSSDVRDPDRTGVLYGSDYIMTLPEEFAAGIRKCQDAEGRFQFERWSELGLPEVNPLWLLKYLPNMPASHIAIYNDLRGANNSLTLREASPGAAIGEAVSTISRGIVDAMVVGATGTRINPFRTLHVVMQEVLAGGSENPAGLSRPFDKDRTGSVLGEGAGAFILEELEFAKARGAEILGEVIGFGSGTAGSTAGPQFIQTAMANALRGAMRNSDTSVGHVNAHGIGTPDGDIQEAAAIVEVLGPDTPPVVAAKSNFGNLGAGGGMVEAIASIKALSEGSLWPTLNYETPDADCPINVVSSNDVPAGDNFVSLNVSPQGQATAFRIAKFAG